MLWSVKVTFILTTVVDVNAGKNLNLPCLFTSFPPFPFTRIILRNVEGEGDYFWPKLLPR